MGTIITDLKEAFRRGNIYIQLIYINVAVFVVTTLTEVILQLFNRSLGGVFEWLELDRLKDEYFYPIFLKKEIFNLPETFTLCTEME